SATSIASWPRTGCEHRRNPLDDLAAGWVRCEGEFSASRPLAAPRSYLTRRRFPISTCEELRSCCGRIWLTSRVAITETPWSSGPKCALYCTTQRLTSAGDI